MTVAKRSAETERLFQEHAEYIRTRDRDNPVDLKRLAELHQAVVRSAQKDYADAVERERQGS